MLLGKQRFDHSQSWIKLTDPAGSSLQPATPSFPSPRALIWKGSIRSREGRRNGSRGQALFEHVSTDDCWAFRKAKVKQSAVQPSTGTRSTTSSMTPRPPAPAPAPSRHPSLNRQSPKQSRARRGNPKLLLFLLVLHTKDKGSFASKAQSQHTAAIEDFCLTALGTKRPPMPGSARAERFARLALPLLPGNNARGSQAVRLRFAVFLGQAQLNSKL